MKTQIMMFDGKEYEYGLCPKCEVWIPLKDFKNDTHKSCKRHQRSLETRRLAEKQVLGMLNKYSKRVDGVVKLRKKI